MRRTHLLTGATSGMGNAIYRKLRAMGDDVIVVVRKADDAARLGCERHLVCDLEDLAQVEGVFGAFRDEIDSFINCAAISLPRSALESTAETIRRITTINLMSPMLITGKVVPRLRDDGVILLFGSQSGFKGSYDDAYAATKGAIHSFVMSLAPKLAPKRRILNFSPGITTPSRMIDQMPEAHQAKKREQIPLRTFGRAEDMAEIVWFLLSPACRYMTGNTIDVNGGLHLR